MLAWECALHDPGASEMLPQTSTQVSSLLRISLEPSERDWASHRAERASTRLQSTFSASPRRPFRPALNVSHKRVHTAVLQKSIPTQICQLILNMSNNKGEVDRCVRKLTVAQHLYKHVPARSPSLRDALSALRRISSQT